MTELAKGELRLSPPPMMQNFLSRWQVDDLESKMDQFFEMYLEDRKRLCVLPFPEPQPPPPSPITQGAYFPIQLIIGGDDD